VQQKEHARQEEERLADTKVAAQSRARQLEQRCRLQDEEMDRLRATVRRLEQEVSGRFRSAGERVRSSGGAELLARLLALFGDGVLSSCRSLAVV